MTAEPIYQQSEGFYVPDFEVKVGSSPVPERVVDDIIEVRFTDEINAIDSFEITLNNWDAHLQTFKYEPYSHADFKDLFEPERHLDLKMGYRGNLSLMTRGIITTVEPNYPESGGPTLAIRGQNILHKFRHRQHSASWEGRTDSEIAKEIGRLPITDENPGLGGIHVRIDEKRAREEPREHVEMKAQHDIEFLLDRAGRRGYVLYVETKDDKDQLYFGPSDQKNSVEYELKWGFSLISFRPTLSTAHQVKSVTVRGIDRSVGQPVEATAAFPGDCDLNSDLLAPRDAHEVIVAPPARSQSDARSRAVEALVEHRRKIVEASGATIGLPNLRAGSYLHITLAEKSRFNGRYFVTSTTHSIGSGGYTTTFKARRESKLSQEKKP